MVATESLRGLIILLVELSHSVKVTNEKGTPFSRNLIGQDADSCFVKDFIQTSPPNPPQKIRVHGTCDTTDETLVKFCIKKLTGKKFLVQYVNYLWNVVSSVVYVHRL